MAKEVEALADPEAWLAFGLGRGWVQVGCFTHDPPFSASEFENLSKALDEGNDPCMHIFRLKEHA